ncbi:helix-turn-helix domain-containing protein [Streptomyces sp. NPDC001759]
MTECCGARRQSANRGVGRRVCAVPVAVGTVPGPSTASSLPYPDDHPGDELRVDPPNWSRRPSVAGHPSRLELSRRCGSDLTPRELQIVRPASEGLTDPEIGSRLFMSPRTVKYHLRKVFAERGIGSPTQIRAVLADALGTAGPTS